MLDASFRRQLDRPLATLGARLAAVGVTPTALTGLGFVIGAAACVAIATGHWWIGMALWLLNRLADGLDGAVARNGSVGPTDLGGFLDIMADFAIYGGVVVAIGLDRPEARVAALVTFLAYYLNGTAFLAWSSLATKRRHEGDGRSLVFPAGLAEGSETIVAYVILLALPQYVQTLLWVWAVGVSSTVVQRIVFVRQKLLDH